MDDGEVPVTNDTYLVNYTQAKALPLTMVQAGFNLLGPEVGGFLANQAKHDIVVYKVNYKTTFKQNEVVASGVVCMPLSSSTEAFPILSFQNGTNTLHSAAPSVNIDNEQFLLIQAIASFGFIVVIPDYLGFGTSSDMFHPYLEKNSTVKSILDMYGAVKEMTGERYLKRNLSNDIYLMGYSQGAWASLALAKEIETNRPGNLMLKGTAVGGGPFNLSSLMEMVLMKPTYPMPVFLGYLINSYIKAGSISASYQDFFNPPFAQRIEGLYNGKRDTEYINGQLSQEISMLFHQKFRDDYTTDQKYATFVAAMQENSVMPWKITTPLFIRHGQNDDIVPAAQSYQLRQDLVDQQKVSATLIDYALYPLKGHNEAVQPFGIDALKWLLNLKK